MEGLSISVGADSIRVMCPLFHAGEGGSIPTSALQLRFEPCAMDVAIDLNRHWHSRLPIINAGNVLGGMAFGAEHAGIWYAVAIWSKPVARLLPQKTWLELRRFAIAPDAPKNTASRMIGWMVREIRRKRPEIETVVSYQDKDVHTGTIYRASGWKPVTLADPRSRPWNNAARVRNEEQSKAEKQRWEKCLERETENQRKRQAATATAKPARAEADVSLFDWESGD